MINYEPPLDEFKFLLHEYLKVSEQDIPGFKELTPEFTSEILEMGAKIAKEVMLPLNRSGDLEGCKFENGIVRTPSGFVKAFSEIKKHFSETRRCVREKILLRSNRAYVS